MQPTITAKDGTQLDGTVVNLARAIRKVESGNSFTAKGASGENGGYQFMPDTWKGWAGKHLKDPNAEMSPINQDKVAYYQIKEWKDQGYSPAQIASLWNSGKPAWEGNVGTNSKGVAYNTPDYVNKVIGEFRTIKATQASHAPAHDPLTPPMTPGAAPRTFFSGLSQDFARRSDIVGEIGARQNTGQQGMASTVLQGAGQVAGGIGDVFAEALAAADRALTGGKIGGALTNVMGDIAGTKTAQNAFGAYQGFKQDNPVAAANLEAAVNIASVVPVGKGAQLGAKGVVAGAEKVAGSEMVQSAAIQATKSAEKNLTDIFVNSSKSTVRDSYEFMTGRGYDPERVLSERKLATQIEIQDGRVRVPDDSPVLKTLLNEVAKDSTLLDKAIMQYPQTLTADAIKNEINDAIARNIQFRQQGRVPELQARASKIVDDYSLQEGKKRFKLIDVQNMKKGQTALSSKYRRALDEGKADEHSAVASAMRQIIEDNAADVAVRKLNRKIGELESTVQLLEKLDGATIRGGRAGRYMARVLGATVGSQGALPVISPVIGALIGDAIITALQKNKIAGPINRLLIKMARVSPDNKLVQETLDFVEAVENGQKVLPTDDVLELLAQLSIKSDIPLLPEPLEREFRSVVGSGAPINLPARSQSTVDAQEIAQNARLGRDAGAYQSASAINPAMTNPTIISNIDSTLPQKGAVSSPGTKSSRPSTVTNTSTSNALTERGGVSAQKTDTSGGFEGEVPKTVRVWIKSKFSNQGAYNDIPVIGREDNLTLYQGGADGDKRQFWTPNKKYAEQFGNVKEKTGSFYKVDNGNRVTDVYVEAPKTAISGGVKDVPKDLAPLYEEAKKYKTAEDWVANMTLKDYRNYLNETMNPEEYIGRGMHTNKNSGAKSRKYGDYLFAQDRDYMENALYNFKLEAKKGTVDSQLLDIWKKANNK